MKSRFIFPLSINLLLIIAVSQFTSCVQSKKVHFNTSTVVPGAEGTIKAKKDKNGNYYIGITIENLAKPNQLTPSKKTYVAWIETQEKGVKNIGQINSSSSFLSKTKKASISTVSPYKPIRIFISAEDDGGIEEPGTMIVLTTDSF